MQTKHLVVIGASAGGIEALRELVRRLPADFAAPIAVVLHSSPESPGVLHEILSRSGSLQAVNPHDGERLQAGRIYVAPPDFHLLIEPGRVRLSKGPRENRFRPAIDPLFRSAAQVFGPAAIGVVLTGNLDDGAAGLWAIKQLGGSAIVQDPEDALFPSMPQHAIRMVDVDLVLPLHEIPAALTTMVAVVPARPEQRPPETIDIEVKIARQEDPLQAGIEQLGDPSPFACPECHGVLLQVKEGSHFRFRCHTGHAYSIESLLAEVNEATERALWTAIRSMQEGTLLMRRLAKHAESTHPAGDVTKLVSRAQELEQQANTLRDMVGETPAITDRSSRP